MTDIYLTGDPEKRQRGRWGSRPELILLLVLSCLAAYVYIRFDTRLDALEQPWSATEKGESHGCEWQPWVLARNEGEHTCPAGSYVNGVGVNYDDGFRRPYPLQYRLYCCALVPTE
jgi:hypothetical protein